MLKLYQELDLIPDLWSLTGSNINTLLLIYQPNCFNHILTFFALMGTVLSNSVCTIPRDGILFGNPLYEPEQSACCKLT